MKYSKKAQIFATVDFWSIVFFVTALVVLLIIIFFTVKGKKTELDENVISSNFPHYVINAIDNKEIAVTVCKKKDELPKNWQAMTIKEALILLDYSYNQPDIDKDCLDKIKLETELQLSLILSNQLRTQTKTEFQIKIKGEKFSLKYHTPDTRKELNTFQPSIQEYKVKFDKEKDKQFSYTIAGKYSPILIEMIFKPVKKENLIYN